MIRDVLPEPLIRAMHEVRRSAWRLQRGGPPGPPRPVVAPNAVRVLVGPANFAGQAGAWATAAHEQLEGVSAVSMSVPRGVLDFPTDYAVPPRVYRSPEWAREQECWITEQFSHLLIDAVRPLTGPLYGDDCSRELRRFRSAGLRVGLIAHGSEIRLPSLHRSLYPFSPFDPDLPATRRREAQVERLRRVFIGYEGPTFVSTPDLLDFAPQATWLPVVVPPDPWVSGRPPLHRARPVVLHVPSNPFLKGSHLVDPILRALDAEGLIQYRRLHGVPPERMPALVADADIVLDQFVLGLYSAMAVQGMLAGRVVVAHVHDRVRARIGEELPVVEADPATLADTLRGIVRDRDHYRVVAAAGVSYAQRFHDGRRSAEVLAGFLGAPPAARSEGLPGVP